MRCLVVIFLLVALHTAGAAQQDSAAAPFRQKMYELSFSGSYVTVSQGSSEGSGILMLSPRLGIFVYEGLEIEPELFAVAHPIGALYYAVNGNVSYNFPLQRRAMVFLLVGYGFGNLIPMGNLAGQGYESTTLGMLNAGGGIKVMAADNVAIRVEYRYLKATGQQTRNYALYGAPFDITQEVDTRVSSVLFGMSLFFGSR